MRFIDEKTRRLAANSLFPSFFYATLGLVLAQAWASQVHGSWGLHVFLGLPGLALSGPTLYRARLHWPAAGAGLPWSRLAAMGWHSMLFAAGAGIGVLVSTGSVLFLEMVTILTYLLPWTRIPVCRAGFVVSSTSMLAGTIAWILLQGGPAHPTYFLVVAWMFHVPAMLMYLLVLMSLDRRYRINEPGVADSADLDVHVSVPR